MGLPDVEMGVNIRAISAMPDERGGIRQAKPNAIAPHFYSTETGCSPLKYQHDLSVVCL
jgi:hypothetical protein